MFQYVKENYLKDKLDAKTILDNISGQEKEEIDINELSELPTVFDPLDDPAEYSSNVDEDYDNESEDYDNF